MSLYIKELEYKLKQQLDKETSLSLWWWLVRYRLKRKIKKSLKK